MPGLVPQLDLLHLFLAGVLLLIAVGIVIYWNVMRLARLLFRYADLLPLSEGDELTSP